MEEISFDKSVDWSLRTFGEFIKPEGIRSKDIKEQKQNTLDTVNQMLRELGIQEGYLI